MFEVQMNTINNPFKPEIIDSTTIILKKTQPSFVQMSYKYDGDQTKLSDEEAIDKVLEDFYSEHYNDKIQNSKITDLELEFAKQKEALEQELSDIKLQNNLITESLFEVIELLLADEPAEEIIANDSTEEEQEEDGTDEDEGNHTIDGD